MKKVICILLTIVMLFSLSGCSDMFGAVLFSAFVAMGDDRAEKEDIFSFVTDNQEELLQAIETTNFSVFANNGIVKDVKADEFVVDFSCGGAGFGPATFYVGFFYTPQDDMTAVWCAPASEDLLLPSGAGFVYQEKNSDNRFYTEKICNGFYYYEASF